MLKLSFLFVMVTLLAGQALLPALAKPITPDDLPAPNAPMAAAIFVNTTSDVVAVDGVCSLREAITAANTNATVNECVHDGSFGTDVIVFSVDGTITLGSSLPAISGDEALTIDGTGHSVTVNGNNSVRVMQVNAGVTLNLNELTIANGRCASCPGGGIENNGGTLNVTNSTLSGNSSPGGFGGGIYNDGPLNVTNSTFFSNTADYAGGIFNSGTLTVTNSTFASNVATQSGGGGGAIDQDGGTSLLTNVTFANNDAPNVTGRDSIWLEAGNMTLRNVLLSNNGTANCTVAGGTLNTDAFSMSSDATCSSATQKTVGEINLGPLADNGGSTQTMALLPGSHAINNANPATSPATDQRGVARPQGAGYDIGAYEYVPTCSTAITVQNANDSGAGSLRQAMVDVCDGGTINFDNDYSIDLLQSSGTLTVTKSMTITGVGHSITLNGGHNIRVMAVDSDVTLNLNTITIADGSAGTGGGILNDGTLNLTSSSLAGNAATSSGSTFGGGGIANGGTLNVISSTLEGNTSFKGGGGIHNYGTLTVRNSTLSANTASFYGGGAILNDFGTLTVTDSTLSGNLANGSSSTSDGGGAIDQYGPSSIAILNNVTLAENNAPNVANRDGIWLEEGSMILRNTLLADNGTINCTIMAGATLTAGTDNMSDDVTCTGATSVGDAALTLPPLATNDGSTQTRALMPGSPALDAGDNDTCTLTDQRGVDRPQHYTCDIGAYEAVLKYVYLPLIVRLQPEANSEMTAD